MGDTNWGRARALFQAASALPDAGGRRAFVIEQAGSDEGLRDEVLSLFDALEQAGSFLEGPRIGPAARFEDLASDEVQRAWVGPWRVVRALGRGGMGIVYLGERDAGDVTLKAAIKVVAGAADSVDVVRRFRTERRILASLDHPGIARLLDGGTTEDGLPYFALEYVEGVPLTEHVRDRQLDLPARLRLFLEVCAAVDFAHRRLVVHRDLKPGNILVGPDGAPKLLDFGIAKILSSATDTDAAPATVTALGWMTPAYASPEQLRGEPTSTATDVYALGLILYELLTGTSAVRPGTDPIAAAQAKLEGTIVRPSTAVLRAAEGARMTPELTRLSRSLSGDLDTIVLKALAAEPARRYASAAALADEIERHLSGRPVLARPDTYGYRAGKFVRRHRWAVGFAAVAVMALVTGLVLALIGRQRALAAEAEARTSAATAQRVSDFMVGLFRIADPGEARGNTVTARELLDRGADRVDAELAAEPDVRSRLRGVMAQAYGELGLYDRQVAILTAEIDEATRRTGGGSAETLALVTRLSVAETRRGRYAEARDLALRAVSGLDALAPNARIDLARALSQAAVAYRELGDLRQASAHMERSLAVRDTLPEQSPQDIIAILNNAAILRWRLGELDAARPLYQRALDLAVATHGEDHPNVGHTLNNMAIMELAAKRYEAAGLLHRRALALRRRLLAADHPDIAESLNNLCDVELARNDLAAAHAACEEALAIRRKVFKDPHPMIATTESNLGMALARQGDLDRARQVLQRSLSGFERTLGPTHMAVSYPLDGLAQVEHSAGRPDLAEPFLRRALALREQALGPTHAEVVGLRGKLVALLRETGKAGEADQLEARAAGAAPGR
jgi:serine/threonine-protein kinase